MNSPRGEVVSASCTNPEYSVAVCPDTIFGRGAGYHMFRTDEPEHHLTPGEVKILAGEDVMQELVDLGNFIAWG